MKRLKTIEVIVKEILEKDELARKDDCYLILRCLQITHPDEIGKQFMTVMMNAKKNKISLSGIARARRKVQSQYPHLKDEITAKEREKCEESYIEFSRK